MEAEAKTYLKEHKVMELFENLTAALVYHRPEDPRGFMRDHILQLQKAKSSSDDDMCSPPSLIDESNIRSVFGMLDITKKGHISCDQYHEAMRNLGVNKYNRNPAGAGLNKIGQETFIRETKAALKDASMTFLDY